MDQLVVFLKSHKSFIAKSHFRILPSKCIYHTLRDQLPALSPYVAIDVVGE